MTVYIYALIDPRNNKIRYIGKTTNKLNIRLSKHVSNTKYGKLSHCQNWIKQLLKLNLKPTIDLIEKANISNWREKEIFWIKFFRTKYNDLTNISDGGDTPDSKALSKALKKMWKNPEYRRKHSGINHHMKKPENRLKVTGKNNGMSGKHHSKEAKEKISKAGKGRKQSEFQKQRASQANKKPKTKKHRINISISTSKIVKKFNYIFEQVNNQKRTLQDLADELGCSLSCVWRTLNKKLLCQAYSKPPKVVRPIRMDGNG